MKILFVMDPLKKLNHKWDNSLRLLKEFARRGHENWIVDVPDLKAHKKTVQSYCRKAWAVGRQYKNSSPRLCNLENFDLILIRKEPPVNAAYYEMLFLLERIADQVPIVNHPAGIRNTNEKLSILNFPKWIPKTIVSSKPEDILHFQKTLRKPVVVKPLDQKGGRGVFILPKNSKDALRRLNRASKKGQENLMAQEFIKTKKLGEKRIVILNGKVLAAYLKRPKGKEFRANLDLGASFHWAPLNSNEKKLIAALKPYLLKNGLYFVGIDVLENKLIEINVTSPAGVTEAVHLKPELRLVEAWADFLEAFSRRAHRRV